MRRFRSVSIAALTLVVCGLTAAYFGHATLAAQDPVCGQDKVCAAAATALVLEIDNPALRRMAARQGSPGVH